MRKSSPILKAAHIYGVIIMVFLSLAFLSKLIINLLDNGMNEVRQIAHSLFHWYDDPSGFIIVFMIAYGLIWLNRLVGSSIIILSCIILLLVNLDNSGFTVMAIITSIVGILYIIAQYSKS